MRRPHLLTICALTALLTGCASMDWNDYSQTILVRSEPAGAKVYAGGKFLGITPAFVRVRRSKLAEIELRYPHQPTQTFQLGSKYRWMDSFASNLMFLTLAPAGWLIDWATGTAWNVQDPPVAKFDAKPVERSEKAYLRVAVAPPIADDLELADAIGLQLSSRLQTESNNRILKYDVTSPTFQTYGSEQGLIEDREPRYNLLYKLNVDQVLVPKVTPAGDRYKVEGEFVDVYSGETVRRSSWEMVPADSDLKKELSLRRNVFDRIHFFPNTVFLTLSNYNPTISVAGDVERSGRTVSSDDFLDQSLRVISAISFERQERPRDLLKGHWSLEFVPSINLSKKRIEFPTAPGLAGSTFDRLYASAGYGAEIGYRSRYGFPYLDLSLVGTYTDLYYDVSSDVRHVSGTHVGAVAEIGYSYFFSDHFVGKIFVKSIGENQDLWMRAIRDIQGPTTDVATVNSNFSGISIGYYIPSSLRSDSRWRVKGRR